MDVCIVQYIVEASKLTLEAFLCNWLYTPGLQKLYKQLHYILIHKSRNLSIFFCFHWHDSSLTQAASMDRLCSVKQYAHIIASFCILHLP